MVGRKEPGGDGLVARKSICMHTNSRAQDDPPAAARGCAAASRGDMPRCARRAHRARRPFPAWQTELGSAPNAGSACQPANHPTRCDEWSAALGPGPCGSPPPPTCHPGGSGGGRAAETCWRSLAGQPASATCDVKLAQMVSGARWLPRARRTDSLSGQPGKDTHKRLAPRSGSITGGLPGSLRTRKACGDSTRQPART
jgi:hypothetical protein